MDAVSSTSPPFHATGQVQHLPRFGIIVVDNDPTPEMEIWQSGQPFVTVHTTRFHLPRAVGEIYRGSDVTDLSDYGLKNAIETLKAIHVDAICLCFTSASIFSDGDFDDDFIRQVKILSNCQIVTTSALALVQSLHQRKVVAPALVVPPWYSDETVTAFDRYFSLKGIRVVGHIPYDLGPAWANVPRQDRFDRGAVWDISADNLFKQVKDAMADASCPIDAIVVPGSGFPSLKAKQVVEQELRVPLLSVNQASLDWCVAATTAT